MRDVYDMNSGLFYCAMTSRPKDEPTMRHGTLKEGLTIISCFVVCMAAIVIAI